MKVLAGIVTYNPPRAVFDRLVKSLKPQTSGIVVVNNGPATAIPDGTDLIQSPANLGVGEALNILVLHALLHRAERVALFDQDSEPRHDHIAQLNAAMTALQGAGLKIASVSPRMVAPAGEPGKPPRYLAKFAARRQFGCDPVLYAPTSGTLIDLEAWRAIGPFRSDYFIDSIDVEWCLRAWSRGFGCWVAPDIKMPHRIGSGSTRLAPGVSVPTQPDFRWMTYARNCAHTLTLRHAPLGWRLAQGAYLAGQIALNAARRQDRLVFLGRVRRAVSDGLRGRLGPPSDLPDVVNWRPPQL